MTHIPDQVWEDEWVRAAFAEWDLGTVIRRIRQLTGISQRTLVRLTGMDQAWLSRLERGRSSMRDVRHVTALVRALEVPIEVLPLAAHATRALRAPDEGRQEQGPSSAASGTTAANRRQFKISVDHEVLLRLQGVLCFRCGVSGGHLDPDGLAFTVSSEDSAPLAWDVRSHASCIALDR